MPMTSLGFGGILSFCVVCEKHKVALRKIKGRSTFLMEIPVKNLYMAFLFKMSDQYGGCLKVNLFGLFL
jgi:hypothetical protein